MTTKRTKRAKVRKQPGVFDYQENLRGVLRDLRNVRGLIPAESSRYGCLVVPADSPMLTIERLLGGTIS